MAGNQSLKDLAYRTIAAAFGAPVDITQMVMRPFGYSTPEREVVGGSEWIGKQMEDAGIVSSARAPLNEFLASLVSPGGAVKGAAIGGSKALPLLGAMTAWHGSPHKFDKFLMDKIGTGEGAQAYGHGLYLAESKDVADIYRKTLTPTDDMVGGQLLDSTNPQHLLARVLNEESGNLNSARKSLEAFARPGGSKSIAESAKSALRLLDAGDRPIMQTVKPEGSLYKTDIPDEAVARFLDWDKPLSQQAPEVQPVLREMLKKAKKSFPGIDPDGDPIAGQVHHLYAQHRGGNITPVADELRQAGIPGIRYLDGGSRGAGQGSSNFVVFDPEMIRILERNGKTLGAQPWAPGEWKK